MSAFQHTLQHFLAERASCPGPMLIDRGRPVGFHQLASEGPGVACVLLRLRATRRHRGGRTAPGTEPCVATVFRRALFRLRGVQPCARRQRRTGAGARPEAGRPLRHQRDPGLVLAPGRECAARGARGRGRQAGERSSQSARATPKAAGSLPTASPASSNSMRPRAAWSAISATRTQGPGPEPGRLPPLGGSRLHPARRAIRFRLSHGRCAAPGRFPREPAGNRGGGAGIPGRLRLAGRRCAARRRTAAGRVHRAGAGSGPG